MRDAAFATIIAASPSGPKSRLNAFQSSPRRAYGELMHANIPPVVASDGRTAFKISTSGFAVLSLRQ
ncbi:MAG: hypothetical protein WBO09_02775, partial [Methylocystis silviterrae]|uniref:hypothetical protein n=1 Tax=Methylocystis silviterrae TaxID=2743612 RepID=UPI003C742C94